MVTCSTARPGVSTCWTSFIQGAGTSIANYILKVSHYSAIRAILDDFARILDEFSETNNIFGIQCHVLGFFKRQREGVSDPPYLLTGVFNSGVCENDRKPGFPQPLPQTRTPTPSPRPLSIPNFCAADGPHQRHVAPIYSCRERNREGGAGEQASWGKPTGAEGSDGGVESGSPATRGARIHPVQYLRTPRKEGPI